MVKPAVADSLDSDRLTPLFEWTFAIVIANLTVQFFRLVAHLTTLIFDIFKLSYGIKLFWPLTTDDLKPYTHYLTNPNEIIWKLIETLLLTVTALYGARCLLNYTITGLAIFFIVFLCHSILLVLGTVIAPDPDLKILSLEFATWSLTTVLEVSATFFVALFISQFSLLMGVNQ